MMRNNKVLVPIYELIEREKLKDNAGTLLGSIQLAISCFLQDLTIDEVKNLAKAQARTYKILNFGYDRGHPSRLSYKMFEYINSTLVIYTFLQSESIISDKTIFKVLVSQREKYKESI